MAVFRLHHIHHRTFSPSLIYLHKICSTLRRGSVTAGDEVSFSRERKMATSLQILNMTMLLTGKLNSWAISISIEVSTADLFDEVSSISR